VFEREFEYLVGYLDGRHKVLSVGCGPAIIEGRLAVHGFNVTGVDVSEEALSSAPDAVMTVAARAEYLPFPEACFDAVVFVASLQFVDDYRSALEAATGVLRPEGTIVAMLLNPESAFVKGRHHDPGSYVSKMKHGVLKDIEDEIAERFAISTEYFLGVKGNRLIESTGATDAALYVVTGTKRGPAVGEEDA
jgi:ubiquinone/menaquinone biosynthesis C-methylase UbiE